MATHELDISAFREMFPIFTDPPYTDGMIQAAWSVVICAMDDADNCALCGDCLQTALYLLLAHVTWLLFGPTGLKPAPVGIKTAATIDKVQVTYTAPPYKSGWQFWLSQTQWGLSLWALLQAMATGGFYVTTRLPEQDGFRKAYGRFIR